MSVQLVKGGKHFNAWKWDEIPEVEQDNVADMEREREKRKKESKF